MSDDVYVAAAGPFTCRLVTPGYLPPELWGPPQPDGLPPCVNYDVMLPEVTRISTDLTDTLADFGLSDVVNDIDELRDVDCLPRIGPVSISSGNVTAQRWTRAGTVINLVYNVTVGGSETLFAFISPDFDNLTANATLEGPVQSLQGVIESVPGEYPAATAEALPDLVQDFGDLLDSFNCSTSGTNCNLTRGEDPVVQLGLLSKSPPLSMTQRI
ncbi:uncharacterized protein LOC118408987 [Branchiostoma floridae]|uniref:Uncharacterized protein LOC118408987 n=1 Tax=Branchiostoma floridae TaxID=7739 RepID=A0A9J7HW61_BRAFL|nr:uncharacterized protein LOC118408987 [Branchiostoma floridae]